MANDRQVPQWASPADGGEPPAAAELSKLAELARIASGARGCLVALRGPMGESAIWAADEQSALHLGGAQIAQVLARWERNNCATASIGHHLAPFDGAVLQSIGIEVEDSARFVLCRHSEGKSTIYVALTPAAAGKATRAVAELAARSASFLLSDSDHLRQASFWRAQASQLLDNLAVARAHAGGLKRIRTSEAAAHRRLALKAERGNLAAIASELSRLGSFDGWVLAAQVADGLLVRESQGIAPDAFGEFAVEFRRLLRRSVSLSRNPGGLARMPAGEQTVRRLGYRSHLSIPLEGGALILLSRGAITPAARARVANCCAILKPYLRSFSLGRELERQRALAGTLVRGLFATADAERASLRRDLHDDLAQLLAAAQIAISGKSEDARRFFRKLVGELRKRLDALRPPQIHGASLKSTVETQLRRLRQAGIEVTADLQGLKRLPAPVKGVLMRVIGEGASNVIRHAGANKVRIEIRCRDGIAAAVVADNGRGMVRRRNRTAGSGIRGLTERVALLGGSCKITSARGDTRLCARIPVADL